MLQMFHAPLFSLLLVGGSLSFPAGSVAQVPDQKASAPAAIAQLVPEETALYVQVGSLDGLRAMSARIQQTLSEDFDLAGLVEPLLADLLDVEQVEKDRPLAMAFAVNPFFGLEPTVLVVPTQTPEPLVASFDSDSQAAPITREGYVGLPFSQSYEPGAGWVENLGGLLAGEFTLRVDLVRVLELFRPMIEGGLESFEELLADPDFLQETPGFDPTPLLELYFDAFRAFLDSAETYDVAFDVEGEDLRFAGAYTAREGTPMATFAQDSRNSLRDVAGYVDSAASATFFLGMDWGIFYETSGPFLQAALASYPDAMRESFEDYLTDYGELMALLGNGMAGSLDIAADGLRATYFARCQDSAKLVTLMTQTLEKNSLASMGVDFSEPQSLERDGCTVTRFQMTVDTEVMTSAMELDAGGDPAQMQDVLQRLYGEDGLQVAVAVRGETVGFVLGGDEAYLARATSSLARGPGPLPAKVERALEQVHGARMAVVCDLDLGRLLGDMWTLAELGGPGAGEIPDITGISARLFTRSSLAGRVWSQETHMDMRGMSALMEAMSGF